MSETKIKDLRINKGLTKQQLIESTTITENDLSFVTDNSVVDVPAPTEAGKVLTSTEDGVEWAEGGSGGDLPDQTGNAGKFLATNGTNASWTAYCNLNEGQTYPTVVFDPAGKVATSFTANPLVAIAPKGDVQREGIGIASSATYPRSVAIGYLSWASASGDISVGYSTNTDGEEAIAIGYYSDAKSAHSVSIGGHAKVARGLPYAIQLGQGTNVEANTFSVGLSDTNNYKLLNADGTIPAERLANTIGDINTLLDALNGESV